MKTSFKRTCAKVTAAALALAMVVGVVPAEAASKPALSASKVSIKVGATKKVTVKKAKAKKVTWSVNKAGKKVVKLSKASKKGVTIKGSKAGKATVTAKIKVGKKTYTKTVKVTVTKKKPSVDPTTAPTTAPTVAPTEAPTQAPEENSLKIDLSKDNEADATKGKESYRTNISFNADGSVSFVNTGNYNGGAFFKLNDEGAAEDLSEEGYKYIKAVVKTNGDDPENQEVFVKAKTASTGYWDGAEVIGKFEGADNVSDKKRVVYFEIGEDADLSEVAMIGVQTKNVSSTASGIIVYSIEFTDTMGETTIENDDAVVPTYRKITISADNEAAATKDNESYRTNIEFNEGGYVSFINTGNYNGGAFFKFNAEGTPEDLSESGYKYVRAVIKEKGDAPAAEEVFVKIKTDSTAYWNGAEVIGKFNGADNVTAEKRVVYFEIGEDADLSEVAMIGVQPKNADGVTMFSSICVYDIALTNTKGDEYVLNDDVVVPDAIPAPAN